MTTTIVRRSERGGTTAELTAANEILLADEVCIELNVAGKRLVKIGDGVTHWLDLPYLTANLTAPAHAVDVTAAPGGSLASTNVQAQLFELDGDLTVESAARATAVTGEATARAGAITTEAAARAAGDALKIDKATATAQTVLGAIADGTPVAFPVGASHLFGRKAAGDLGQLTPAEAITILAVYTAAQTDTAISSQINALVGGAPGLLDTLKEIADALGDDPNFAATMTAALANKQPLNAALTAIAALTTQAYGRSLLTIASQGALMTALAGDAAFTTGIATASGVMTFTTAGIASGVDAATALAGLSGTLRVRSGETLYVNLAADLITPNLELEVMKGGQVKVDGAGKSFQTSLKGCPQRTIIDTAGTGVFVPTNQPIWQPIWWGPVITANDTAPWQRGFAAKAFLGNTGFFTGFSSGQKFQIPTGVTRWKDLDIPNGCDVGGVLGGSMVAPTASAPIAYMVKIGDWAGLHDCWVDSHAITNKTLVWITGQRSYAHLIYGSGSLGAAGTFVRIGAVARTITDGVISGTTTLTSAAQAVFTTADINRGVSGAGIPAGTTISAYVSPTVVTLSAACTNGAVSPCTIAAIGSLSVRIRDVFGRGSGDGTGISNEASDVEWNNCWFGVFGRNIDAPYGALMGNGIHSWGATTDGFRGSGDSIRLSNFYSENNGVATGGWGADMTASDRSVIDVYYIWQNGNGIKYSTGVSRVVADGVLNTTTTVTSATAIFSSADVNLPISGAGIPAGTTIVSYAADGLSCVMSAAATATGGGVSVTIRAGAAVSCTNNVLGNGVFDDNVDTALELDDATTTYVTGANFGSLTNGVGGGRRGIHAGPGSTATVRAKGSNKWFTQRLKVDDSKGGLDIELGRKRLVASELGIADYTDQTATYQTMCGPLPYGYNDEWEGEYQVCCEGNQGSDVRIRLEPSALGTGMDGRMHVIGAPNASATAGSATSMIGVNTVRLNVAVPTGIVVGTIGVLQEQTIDGKFRFKAGSVPGTDNGNLYLQVGSGVAQGNLRTITDGVVSTVTTTGDTLTSATQAVFTAADVGRTVVGAGIPAGTYISARTSATVVTLSQGATVGPVASIDIGPGFTKVIATDTVLVAVRRG